MSQIEKYPMSLYRGKDPHVECLVVNTEQAHEAAKLEGWGDHPSQAEQLPKTLKKKLDSVV